MSKTVRTKQNKTGETKTPKETPKDAKRYMEVQTICGAAGLLWRFSASDRCNSTPCDEEPGAARIRRQRAFLASKNNTAPWRTMPVPRRTRGRRGGGVSAISARKNEAATKSTLVYNCYSWEPMWLLRRNCTLLRS